jgi:hypothetical protein
VPTSSILCGKYTVIVLKEKMLKLEALLLSGYSSSTARVDSPLSRVKGLGDVVRLSDVIYEEYSE